MIAFLIRSLHHGGAERQLVNLVIEMQKSHENPTVIVYYRGGALEKELDNAGVRIVSLEKSGRWDMLGPLFSLWNFLRRERPVALYSFLPTSNVMAIVGRLLWHRPKIVWGVRSSFVDLSKFDRAIGFTYYLERKLSWCADLIIYNSNSGREFGKRAGMCPKKTLVIPNGIDTQKFAPNAAARDVLRAKLGIEDKFVIGTVARIDPMKDHATLLRTVANLSSRIKNLQCICVGRGDADLLNSLKKLAENMGISHMVQWLDGKDEVQDFLTTFDIFILTSIGEAFPNAVAEAMSTSLPIVTTDVGDCQQILGGNQWLCQPGDDHALAEKVFQIYSMSEKDRHLLGVQHRAQIVSRFSIVAMYQLSVRALK